MLTLLYQCQNFKKFPFQNFNANVNCQNFKRANVKSQTFKRTNVKSQNFKKPNVKFQNVVYQGPNYPVRIVFFIYKLYIQSFAYSSANIWNSINPDIRSQQSINSFKNAYIKDYFSV